jgi:hypothetical protein
MKNDTVIMSKLGIMKQECNLAYFELLQEVLVKITKADRIVHLV